MGRAKKIAFTLITACILLVLAELAARFVLNRDGAISIAERKNTFEPYQEKSWTEQYFKDEAACAEQRERENVTSAFIRYIMYDLDGSRCETPTINYFGGNQRKTWNPDIDPQTEKREIRTVAFFGGSTMQGAGVPDDLTIPSQFSQIVNSATGSVIYRVENYGVSGYTNTQAIMKLVILLREGKKFDHVIFYGGANDIDNAYEAGEAGAFYAEKTIENRLFGGLRGQIKEAFKDQLTSCGLCRFIITASRNTPVLKDYVTPSLVQVRKFLLFKEGATKSEDSLAPFAGEIADYYVKSHDFLDKLSKVYGFTYLEFWQPTLHYENGPVGGEAMYWNIDNRLTDEKLKTLFRLTLADVRAANLNNFTDLSNALAQRTKAYYLDAVHIGEEGNAAVAQEIANVFARSR